MFKISKRTLDRMRESIKKYQKITRGLQERDVSEADTVTVIKDILADVFGYDKYLELTGEQQIRGTYCDLAVKLEGKIRYLIEAKAAGVELSESHIRQAVDYGAKEGIEWVVLTNSICWHLYRIKFGQPIEHEEVAAFCLPEINLRHDEDQQKLFLLSRESVTDGSMDVYLKHTQLLNGYTMAQIVLTEPVIATIRKQFRKLFPELKTDKEDISNMLLNEVLKRDVIASDKSKEASSKVRRALNKYEKRSLKRKAKVNNSTPEVQNIEAPLPPDQVLTE